MSTQHALALPSPAPSNTVVINARCSLRIEADQRVIVVAGLPVHHYRAEDAVAEAYAMVFLVESGFAQANGCGAGVRAVGAHYSALSRALWRRRDGGAQSRGRVAARPTTYLRETPAQHRDAEEPGHEQPRDRAAAGRHRERHPQADLTFEAHHQHAARVGWPRYRCGEAGGEWRAACHAEQQESGSHRSANERRPR